MPDPQPAVIAESTFEKSRKVILAEADPTLTVYDHGRVYLHHILYSPAIQ